MHIPKTICFNILLLITFLLSNTLTMPAACQTAPSWSLQHPEEPPLIRAVMDGDFNTVFSLLSTQQNIIHQENDLGTTAIMAAVYVEQPNKNIIAALLRAGADPHRYNHSECSAFLIAIKLGLWHIAEDFMATPRQPQ